MAANYEVNANGNRTYANANKAKVMSVAKAWKKQGHEPKMYAILEIEGKVATEEIKVA